MSARKHIFYFLKKARKSQLTYLHFSLSLSPVDPIVLVNVFGIDEEWKTNSDEASTFLSLGSGRD